LLFVFDNRLLIEVITTIRWVKSTNVSLLLNIFHVWLQIAEVILIICWLYFIFCWTWYYACKLGSILMLKLKSLELRYNKWRLRRHHIKAFNVMKIFTLNFLFTLLLWYLSWIFLIGRWNISVWLLFLSLWLSIIVMMIWWTLYIRLMTNVSFWKASHSAMSLSDWHWIVLLSWIRLYMLIVCLAVWSWPVLW
jgi:hypothetical protein